MGWEGLFFFNDTATTEIYTLALHDALPICEQQRERTREEFGSEYERTAQERGSEEEAERELRERRGQVERQVQPLSEDRKSTRLNSSHANISYAVFCLKKKKTKVHTKTEMKAVYT